MLPYRAGDRNRPAVSRQYARREQAPAWAPEPEDQPRPIKGILVAMMVMNCTLLSSGSSAMCTTA